MSIKNTHSVTCPNCNNSQETTIYSSVNISLDKEIKSKLYNGEINLFKCNECSHESYIPVPFLYHDMDRKFAAHYFPKTSMKDTNFLSKFDLNGKLKTDDLNVDFKIPEYMHNIHIVFDMNELLSYIIFREILFDYVSNNN